MTVRLTNYGASIVGIDVPDKHGKVFDVVLGYDDLDGYINGRTFQGATIGRYANRIAGGKFTLNGVDYSLTQNDGLNCLHGGRFGFDKRVWCTSIEEKKNSVTFTYLSPEGDEHFPGNLEISVKYTLTIRNGLKIEYKGRCDTDTIFNPTNHVYFNLNDDETILNTVLQINALNYTPVDEFLIPTGDIETVLGTPFNFNKPKRIGDDIEKGLIDGYDHNFLLGDLGEMRKVAVCHDPKSGRIMACFTDMPAIQLYTGNGLNEVGKNERKSGKYGAFCLETQFSPNSPNIENFPSCVLKKDKVFKSTTIYAFGIK
ncbi:aldose-1-epimerase [Holotrichia oblita]|nr:aldose-1-epimerase [Holotrichia oblita]